MLRTSPGSSPYSTNADPFGEFGPYVVPLHCELRLAVTRGVITFPEPGDPRAIAANVPTTAMPTAAVSRRACFLFIPVLPCLFDLPLRGRSRTALPAAVRLERRAAAPRRARAPCRAPPARDAGLRRRVRPRARREPRTRSRNEAPCPRFLVTRVESRPQTEARCRQEKGWGLLLKVFLAGRVAVQTNGVVIDEAPFPGRQGRL